MALAVRRENVLLGLAAGLSLAAVAVGAWVCALNDVPAALWGRNLAAWAIGAVAALGLARLAPRRLLPAAVGVALVGLAASLVSAGQMGVHRWIAAGPLTMNVAMLTLPAAVVAIAALGRQSRWPWLAALLALAILGAQPDASQATAFGAALAWIALRTLNPSPARAALILGSLLLAAGAWLRPDPLAPVPEVEEILKLAYAVSPALAAAAMAALLGFSAMPGLAVRGASREAQETAVALSLYLLISALAPFVGAFPVPLIGVGVSPVLGAWLGVGVLASVLRAQARRA